MGMSTVNVFGNVKPSLIIYNKLINYSIKVGINCQMGSKAWNMEKVI